MNRRERVRVEQINRVAAFMTANAADLNGLSPTAKTKAQALAAALSTPNTGFVARLGEFETGQQTGSADFHGSVTSKSVLRDGIMADLAGINEVAAAIADAEGTPELMDHFRMPHGVSDEKLRSVASAFAKEAGKPAVEPKMIELGLPLTFVQDLEDRVAAFEQAKDEKADGLEDQKGARTGLGATIRGGLTVTKQLNVVMKNLYRNDPAKATAWATAAHIQRVGTSGKKKKTAGPANP